MLKDRAWIELAVVYNDGRRAILGTRRSVSRLMVVHLVRLPYWPDVGALAAIRIVELRS
jgi:hypothetical protein